MRTLRHSNYQSTLLVALSDTRGNFNLTKQGAETMKYETPELTTLSPAINAVQSPVDSKNKDMYL